VLLRGFIDPSGRLVVDEYEVRDDLLDP